MGSGRSIGSACSSTRIKRFAMRVSIFPFPYWPLLYSSSSALENDASNPGLLVAADAAGICPIGVGSSRRNIPKRPPRFLSASADGTAAGGALHSLAGGGGAADSGAWGSAPGAQVFAGASLAAGGAVVQDSAGRAGPSGRGDAHGSAPCCFVQGSAGFGAGAFAAGA